jgi:beta-xylosidase
MLTARPDPTVTQPMTQQFQNPVLRADFPDPSVIFTGDQYYAYATNSAGRNIQVARSSNLITWELLPDALPALPTWAKLGGSFVWAPEVIQIGEQFVMYYTARDKTSNRQCIGVATSVHPAGQFVDSNQQPLICQSQEGGSIDASPFRDADGTLYLYWKNDGNCCGVPTYLYGQKLSPDGLSLVGEPTRLLRNEARWEGRVIEAPTMWRQNDTYFLFFSGNNYTGFEYAVGYAVCKAPLGLCTAAAYNPILKSVMNQQPLVIGPGHQALINDQAGNTWMFYHVWEVTADGRRGNRRFLWLDRVLWTDGRPRVQGPTTTVQLLDQ